MKRVICVLALALMLSACGGAAEATPASEVLIVDIDGVVGRFEKPAGCNDPCPSIKVSFTTIENPDEQSPICFINWDDGSAEEQLKEGTHTYPLGVSRDYTILFRCDTVIGPATGSVQLKTKIPIPFVLPPEEPEDLPVEGE